LQKELSDILSPLLAQYHAKHDITQVPIKVDLLKPLIEERGFVDRIVWEELDYEGKAVIAKVEFYRAHMGVYAGVGDYARIQYSASLNLCWQRFAIAKEMFHCLLDEKPTSRVTNADDVLKVGQMLIAKPYAVVEDYEPHNTETIAELLALEVLFPIELRSRHKEAYDAGEITDYQLALRYRIPEFYVGIAMLKGYYEFIYANRLDTFISELD
jgi:hypothetical protein